LEDEGRAKGNLKDIYRYVGRDSNRVASEYKPEAVPVRPTCSVACIIIVTFVTTKTFINIRPEN
jgi:hypothetical protein